jgi:hypothetical protein
MSCVGDNKGAYRVLVEKPKRKRQLGIPIRSWKHNFKIDFQTRRVC